jgi:hypothetical protein
VDALFAIFSSFLFWVYNRVGVSGQPSRYTHLCWYLLPFGFLFCFLGIGRSICIHNPGDEQRIKAGDRLLLRLRTGGRSFEMVVVLVIVNLFEGRSAVDAGAGNAHNGLSTRTTVYVDGSWWALPTSDVPVLLLPFRVACKLAQEWASSSLPRQTLLLCLITSRIQCYCCVQVFAQGSLLLGFVHQKKEPIC